MTPPICASRARKVDVPTSVPLPATHLAPHKRGPSVAIPSRRLKTVSGLVRQPDFVDAKPVRPRGVWSASMPTGSTSFLLVAKQLCLLPTAPARRAGGTRAGKRSTERGRLNPSAEKKFCQPKTAVLAKTAVCAGPHNSRRDLPGKAPRGVPGRVGSSKIAGTLAVSGAAFRQDGPES